MLLQGFLSLLGGLSRPSRSFQCLKVLSNPRGTPTYVLKQRGGVMITDLGSRGHSKLRNSWRQDRSCHYCYFHTWLNTTLRKTIMYHFFFSQGQIKSIKFNKKPVWPSFFFSQCATQVSGIPTQLQCNSVSEEENRATELWLTLRLEYSCFLSY